MIEDNCKSVIGQGNLHIPERALVPNKPEPVTERCSCGGDLENWFGSGPLITSKEQIVHCNVCGGLFIYNKETKVLTLVSSFR